MTRLLAPSVAGLLALAVTTGALIAQGGDPFYTALADDGVRAYESGDVQRASEELRIAAFGLLDSPRSLARVLSYLALAQHDSGDREGFVRSYARLRELESRFESYSQADLDSSIRGRLDEAARGRLGVSDLSPAPAVASLPLAADSPEAPRPRLCISWDDASECRQVAPVPDPTTPSPEELEAYGRLDRLTSEKAPSRRLRTAFEEARTLADRHQDWRDMQRVAAVLGARSGAFAEAVQYYERAGSLMDDGPVQLFYLSVALFETDQLDAAANVLRRALPALEQNREVRKYVRRILDGESAG